MSAKLYTIFHNKFFDELYVDADRKNIVLFDVNENYVKDYSTDKGYEIVKEYKLPEYDPKLQQLGYCQTSAMVHVFLNSFLYKELTYVGFIQYDMKCYADTISMIEGYINRTSKNKTSTDDEIIFEIESPQKLTKVNDFQSFSSETKEKQINIGKKEYIFHSQLLPVEHLDSVRGFWVSILAKYNAFFGTTWTRDSVLANERTRWLPILHTFCIPVPMFERMMSWFTKQLIPYLNQIPSNSLGMDRASFIERCHALFLCLELASPNVSLIPLHIDHIWPRYHQQTAWNNYKTVN